MTTPAIRPKNPYFSSGPCSKRPGYNLAALKANLLGRSHRSKPGKDRLQLVIEKTRTMLGVPAHYRIGIVAASDTGAVEMALWSLLGSRPVDVLAWEAFSNDWLIDITKQLKLKDTRTFTAPYGQLPDLKQINKAHDIVFAWNGTTSGARVPNGDWIAADREGLTICDATSAAFAMTLPWDKLDVTTFSWQKVLGGEAQHGILILSPRAVTRLESYTPVWPMPKIFRMTKGGKLVEGIFQGETINTPSMLCVEDILDALTWAESVGGLTGLIQRSEANLAAITAWVETSSWAAFLTEDKTIRSCTSICLKIIDPWFTGKTAEDQAAIAKKVANFLEKEGVAFDIGAYRDAPPGLRVWRGATVETADIKALLPWLDYAYKSVKQG